MIIPQLPANNAFSNVRSVINFIIAQNAQIICKVQIYQDNVIVKIIATIQIRIDVAIAH